MSLRGNNFGRMDTQIVIESPSYSAGSAEPSSWTTFKTCYAERVRKSGGENITNNQQVASQGSDYRIRYDGTVTEIMRLYELRDTTIRYYIRDVQHWNREGYSLIQTEKRDDA